MSIIEPEIKIVTRFFGAYDTSTDYSSSHNNHVEEFPVVWRDFGKFVERKPPDYMYLHDITIHNHGAFSLAVEVVINEKTEMCNVEAHTYERVVPYRVMTYDWEDEDNLEGYEQEDQSPCCLKLAIKVEDSAPDKVLWWRRMCRVMNMKPLPDEQAFDFYDENKELIESQPTIEATRLLMGLLISAEGRNDD